MVDAPQCDVKQNTGAAFVDVSSHWSLFIIEGSRYPFYLISSNSDEQQRKRSCQVSLAKSTGAFSINPSPIKFISSDVIRLTEGPLK